MYIGNSYFLLFSWGSAHLPGQFKRERRLGYPTALTLTYRYNGRPIAYLLPEVNTFSGQEFTSSLRNLSSVPRVAFAFSSSPFGSLSLYSRHPPTAPESRKIFSGDVSHVSRSHAHYSFVISVSTRAASIHRRVSHSLSVACMHGSVCRSYVPA